VIGSRPPAGPELPDRLEILRSSRVVTPSGTRPAAVHVGPDGRVAAVTRPDQVPPAAAVTDVGDLAVLPGLVDSHVHVNEPGRTRWEGFATATRAAAAGGVTAIVDMPLNSIPPTTSLAALATKRAAAEGRIAVDVGFFGGIVSASGRALADLGGLHDAGVFGFKAFLSPSGVAEFPHVPLDVLGTALGRAARLGALTVVHAESPSVLAAAPPASGRGYASWLASRPPAAETEAVASLAGLAAATGARVHVLHLSASAALDDLVAARDAGVALTAETCPHYLTLLAEDVPDGSTVFKCAPPIREAPNQDRLWEGLEAGLFAAVVSDHSPSDTAAKQVESGDFGAAWGGIASLQLGLPVMWTRAATRGRDLADLAAWMCAGPADLVGLGGKGRIQPGGDADLVVFDPEASFVVDPTTLRHRHPLTPYAGFTLRGVVQATYLRGRRADADGPARGRLLAR
jgi:allantoinase